MDDEIIDMLLSNGLDNEQIKFLFEVMQAINTASNEFNSNARFDSIVEKILKTYVVKS